MALKLYGQLASWWPLLSRPADYAEEAAFFARNLRAVGDQPARALLELGSGGGNNASHLKACFEMVLVDLSPEMLAVSYGLNPECEHVRGDMRTVRLGRHFDRVFIHDAISYMTTKDDVRRAILTAFEHCRPGGAALFVPDHVRENYRPSTSHGGHDAGGRGLRYLEWNLDPDPTDTTYISHMVYMLREPDGTIRVEHDEHVMGVFGRDEWLQLIAGVGFEPSAVPFEHSELEPGSSEVFIGVKRRA